MSSTSPIVQNFLNKLDNVRTEGDGWSARCPCRSDDHNPSVHVGEGRDGRVLVTCHRGDGCNVNEICSAVGISVNDLFPPKVEEKKQQLKWVASYDFVDENGELLFQKVRYVDETGRKTFRQRKPDGKGNWTYSLGDTPKVLYRLPEVVAAAKAGGVVWVVEGEKDADTVRAAGEVATTMPGGAGKWLDIHTEALKGAEVFVVRDNDTPGIKHAVEVDRCLKAAGVDSTLCAPPDGFKDVTDFFAAGGDFESLLIWNPDEVVQEVVQDVSPAPVTISEPDDDLEGLIDQIRDLQRADLSHSAKIGRIHSLLDRLSGSDLPLDAGRLVDWDSFINTEAPNDDYDWVIPGLLERQDRVIVVAAEGVGKTMLARQVAIASSAGVNPFSYEQMDPIRTLTIDLENPERIIRRMSASIFGASVRLSRFGGPKDRAHLLIKPAGVDLLKAPDRVLIEETIERTKPDLICLGPLYKSFLDPGSKTSEAVAVEVARYIDYLRTTYNCAFWMEHHAPLGGNGGRELRPFGSAVWSRWPEFGLTLEPDLTADAPFTYKVGNFRGDRDVRHRPVKIKRGKVFPFEVIEFLRVD
jgi:hypothetical protein